MWCSALWWRRCRIHRYVAAPLDIITFWLMLCLCYYSLLTYALSLLRYYSLPCTCMSRRGGATRSWGGGRGASRTSPCSRWRPGPGGGWRRGRSPAGPCSSRAAIGRWASASWNQRKDDIQNHHPTVLITNNKNKDIVKWFLQETLFLEI